MHDDSLPPLEPIVEPGVVPLPAPAPASERDARAGRGATALVAIVALLAGAVGGFVGGRASAGDGEGPPVATAAGDPDDDADSEQTGITIWEGGSDTHSTSSASVEMPEIERMFKRAVPGGELRVWKYQMPTAARCQGTGCPPPECMPNGYYQAMVIGEWDISSGGGSIWPAPTASAFIAGVIAPSTGQGNQAVGVFVRTSDAVRLVRWVDADGSVRDQMAPEDGLAVVTTQLTDFSPATTRLAAGTKVEALDASGRVVWAADFGNRVAFDLYADGGVPESCHEPVEGAAPATTAVAVPDPNRLPDPGEQPADRAGAEAAVRAVFTVALGNPDLDAANRAIDDPDGLQAAREASAAQFPQYKDKIHFVIDGIVFTTPTRAAIAYHVDTETGQTIARQVGSARLVDGRWLITRSTVCNLLPVKPTGTC